MRPVPLLLILLLLFAFIPPVASAEGACEAQQVPLRLAEIEPVAPSTSLTSGAEPPSTGPGASAASGGTGVPSRIKPGHLAAGVSAPGAWIHLYFEQEIAGGDVVSADASSGLHPDRVEEETHAMIAATPGYLETLAAQLQATLNEVALHDVCTFIEAMEAAGTPQEMEAAARALVASIYSNVTDPGASPQETSYTCIVVCVAAPGQECEPWD